MPPIVNSILKKKVVRDLSYKIQDVLETGGGGGGKRVRGEKTVRKSHVTMRMCIGAGLGK